MIRPDGAPMNIANGVREFARAKARDVAVIDGGRQLTYAALDERASRLASALLARGLTPGERVGVLLGNRMEYVEVAAGLAKAGLPMVPINPRQTSSENEYVLGHAGARALVLDGAFADVAGGAVEALGIEHVLAVDGGDLGSDYEDELARARAVDPGVEVAESDPFCIAYTSGTTGRPKGVMISHRSRCLTFLCTALEWGMAPGRTTLAVAPMYHGAGFAFAYVAVYTGGTVAMLRRWDPEGALAAIAASGAQSVFLVPTHAQMVRGQGEDVIRRHDLSRLEVLYFNAAPMPFPLKEWVLDTFPGVAVSEVYGSTEAGVVTCLRPEDQRRKPGSVGPPWFLTELRLVDDDGRPVAPGEIGELFSRSPYLMNGYLDDPDATAGCTTEDGFLSAGDLATQDEDGYVSIVDRKKDLVISGGSNVYPREVEDALVRHPAVEQVAVIGTPSEQWGEEVTAVIVLRPTAEATADDLDAFCRRELAGYKVPRRYEFVASIPASPAGKVLKRELRDRLAAADQDSRQ